MTNKECNLSWLCFRILGSIALVKAQSGKRWAQLFLGVGKVCTITDEVCMHAKDLKLLSLATKIERSLKEMLRLPPTIHLQIKSTILLHHIENKIGKDLQK